MLQHGAYTLLMDACYDREQFPTKEEALDWVWASSQDEIDAVEFVLRRFFELEDGVYVQHRIKEELDSYQAKAEVNKRIALEREAKRREAREAKLRKKQEKTNEPSTDGERTEHEPCLDEHEPCTSSEPDVHEPPPNHKPLTTNQEPITKDLKDLSTKADIGQQSFEVFQYWKLVMKKNGTTGFSAKRKSKIESRLKDGYPIEEIKRAIDHCANTAHNMGFDRNGNKTGKKYDDIELICRNAENLERFRDNPGDMNLGILHEGHQSNSGINELGISDTRRRMLEARARRDSGQEASRSPVGPNGGSVYEQVGEEEWRDCQPALGQSPSESF